MTLYIAYWTERNPVNIVIEEFEATRTNPTCLQEKYTWSPDDITPDIYPMYRGSNFGKEERCPQDKRIHYMIHESLNVLKDRLSEIIDRHIGYYCRKVDLWNNVNIILPEHSQTQNQSK